MNRMLLAVLLVLAVLGTALMLEGTPFRTPARTPSPEPHPSLDRPGRNKAFAPLKRTQRARHTAHPSPRALLTASAETVSNASVYRVWAQQHTLDWGGLTWYANISIGTPPQPFTVAFCSYWGDSWVADSSCDTYYEDDYTYYEYTDVSNLCNATLHRQFNSTASSTYVPTDESFEGDDYDDIYPGLFGFMGTDTLRMGPVNSPGWLWPQLVLPGAEFAQIDYLDDDAGQMDDFAFDGVIALGTQSMTFSDDPPLLAQAVSQGIIPANTYTMYLPVSSPTTMLYTLGGLDSVNCGSVPDWIPATSSELQFTIDSVHVGSASVTNDTTTAGVFSDVPLLVSDATKIGRIVDAVGATRNLNGFYQIKCDAVYDPLTFVINGQEYNVTSAALTIDVGLDNNWCMFGVNSLASDTDWSLGTPLLRQFCVSFDLEAAKIGLAVVNGL